MTTFPAPAHVPGQQASRAAWRDIQAAPEKPAWWQDYLSIREAFPHFRNWRVWVYIAWAGQPAAGREPKTLEEFAPAVLGCTSKAVRNWKAKTWGGLPTIEEAIAWVQAAPLLQYRRDIYEALVRGAVSPQGNADRKLALELMGDYKNPKQAGETEDKPFILKVIKGISMDDL